jgi:hypothetical protein
MRKPVLRRGLVALPAILFLGVQSVHAEDPEVTALRQQLQVLKDLMSDFEARLDKLATQRGNAVTSGEQRPPSPTSPTQQAGSVETQGSANSATARAEPAPTATEHVQRLPNRDGWLQVTQGMTQAEINTLVGAPQKIFTLNGKTVWYYMYPGVGAGSVFFGADGRASSYQKPPVGLWMW